MDGRFQLIHELPCTVPTTNILVFSGFTRLLLQHHSKTLCRSSSICRNECSICDNENDKNVFESSTYDSRLQLLGTEDKLSVYILNKDGDRTEP